MPDFAVQLQFLRSRWNKQSMESAIAAADILPPGDVESSPLGSHYAVRGLYPHDYFHGKVRLSRFSTTDLECLMLLMKERGTIPSRDRIVFLDTETTGIQGGAGMCPFLVGLGCFAGDEFHMLQYFIRDFDEEPSMLYALGERLSGFELVVTYNGAAFDIPLLETRFTLARLDSPFQNLSHFDLLFTARRLWKNGHGSCRLTALEREMLSFFRGPDVPGSMIPRVYFDYLQRRPSSTLNGVFTHNVHDVVSLAALTLHACDRVTLEPARLDEPLDLYSLARILQNSRDWRRSIHFYEMALAGGLAEPVQKKALEELCVVYRRAGDHEHSRDICHQLMAYPDFSMTGYEGAAIYHERVRGDLESAIRVLEEGIARAESKRWNVLLRARWNRLQQKVIRYE
ncbi:MAG: hypothetical protein DMG11_13675 [Acidobacteria bacterium]|nr:MAG: hypothetical protein DMG11_13675 [Acidobacteriota bacterium]